MNSVIKYIKGNYINISLLSNALMNADFPTLAEPCWINEVLLSHCTCKNKENADAHGPLSSN